MHKAITQITCFFVTVASTKLTENYRHSSSAFVTKYDHVLPGKAIASLVVPSMISCNQRCLSYENCVSFNYQVNGPTDGNERLCELKDEDEGDAQRLVFKPGYVFVTMSTGDRYEPRNCLDHLRSGAIRSGLYRIFDDGGTSYWVYCDQSTESGMAWTLVMSQTFKNRAIEQFNTKSLRHNGPLNQESPRWDAYRLSLSRMNGLRSVSSHWRVTCNFHTEGLQYRDYVRARFSEFDCGRFYGAEGCKKVEYINVRGHNCTECTVAWWQKNNKYILYHDSSSDECQFGSSPGFVKDENNFGFYKNHNPEFRCSAQNESSTNHWFGSFV